MKTMIPSLLFLGLIFQTKAQIPAIISDLSQCAPVSLRVIQAHYSIDAQSELNASPLELSRVNYYLSASYSFPEGEMILKSQKALVDITQYEYLRHTTMRAKVFDEVSGVEIILLSKEEMEQKIAELEINYAIAQK